MAVPSTLYSIPIVYQSIKKINKMAVPSNYFQVVKIRFAPVFIYIHTIKVLVFLVFLFSLYSRSVRKHGKQYQWKTPHKYEPTRDRKTKKTKKRNLNRVLLSCMFCCFIKIKQEFTLV